MRAYVQVESRPKASGGAETELQLVTCTEHHTISRAPFESLTLREKVAIMQAVNKCLRSDKCGADE